MKKVIFLLMVVCLMFCGTTGNDTEKFQTQRNKVVNVHDRVQAFDPGDLLTLLDDELNLKCYVKGPKWNEKRDNLHHFGAVAIYGDYILALYDGTLWNEANSPRICHVFDLEGNYVKTLDFDYNVHTISIDEEKARMYVSMDDVIQFGYLDLKGILN